jgi:hypothetical protein
MSQGCVDVATFGWRITHPVSMLVLIVDDNEIERCC